MNLYTYSGDDLSLLKAVKDFRDAVGNTRTYALLYSASECRIAVVEETNGEIQFVSVKDRRRETLDSKTVFEARVFNETAELRWLHTENGRGNVAVITEHAKLNLFNNTRPDEQEIAGPPLSQTYLIWGKRTDAHEIDGWNQFSTARIGALEMPVNGVDRQESACFTALEYFKEYDDGNVAVLDERLTGISPIGREKKQEEGKNNG